MSPPNDLIKAYRRVPAIVLGASGFIGRWVARYLADCEAAVYLVVRNKTEAQRIFSQYNIHGHLVECDLQDFDQLRLLFQTIKPPITFNLAGYGIDRAERDEPTAYAVNTHLVQAICQAVTATQNSRWTGQDFVHVGSALEYGEIGGNLSEDTPPNPTTLYGQSKLAGTQLLADYSQKHQIKGLTARLFTVYGPGEHNGRLLPVLRQTAQTGVPLELTAGTQKRDFTYVEEVAEGLLRLGLSGAAPGQIVNLATGRLTSVRQFAETAAQIMQIPADHLKFGAIPTRTEEMQHDPVTVKRLQQLTGWLPSVDIETGIQRTLAFTENLS